MQAASFLREHPDASPGTLARGLGGSLSLAPQEAGAEAENAVIPRIHDGFFYALFVKGAE